MHAPIQAARAEFEDQSRVLTLLTVPGGKTGLVPSFSRSFYEAGRAGRAGRAITGALLCTLFTLIPLSPPAYGAPPVTLQIVGNASSPVGFALHPDGSMFVVEQGGLVRAFTGTEFGATALDVATEISDGGEQGLLNAVFSNDGSWLYVDLTNVEGDTEVRAYPFARGTADRARAVLLLQIKQPYANHNGGGLVVDSRGVLWIGMGDGGSAGDPENRSQNLGTHLGKILRILPTPTDARPYQIPSGNLDPKRGRAEIWAYGLRNPWRITIDESTQLVWIGDVGQGDREEVNAVAMNAKLPNFGWRLREGTRAYKGGKRLSGSVDPVYDYPHSSGGCSITGGVVYRGSALSTLTGSYLFSDYCDGKIRIARRNTVTGKVSVTDSGVSLKQAASFGVDARGEVFIAATNGAIAKLVSPGSS